MKQELSPTTFRIPKSEIKGIRRTINLIAAAESIPQWQAIKKALGTYARKIIFEKINTQ
jgi:hypothetical protein